jgi:nucleotide-binding universal stress UspA family protein
VHDGVVVGYDGTQGARDAVAFGARLAAATARQLVLVCVVASQIPEWTEDGVENRPLVARRAQAVLDAAPVPREVERHLVAEESVARGLHQFAERDGATAIVVGCPDRTRPGRIEAGTVAERLLHGSPCAVALAPRGYAQSDTGTGFQRIVVAYTPTDEARAALRAAAGLARACGAAVRVVSVLPAGGASGVASGGDEGSARAVLHADLDRSLRALASSMPVEGHVLEGDPVERVLEEASGWADLIVTGSRGHGPATAVLLGSVSAGLLTRAEVPVLVVPRGAATELVAEPPTTVGDGRP